MKRLDTTVMLAAQKGPAELCGCPFGKIPSAGNPSQHELGSIRKTKPTEEKKTRKIYGTPIIVKVRPCACVCVCLSVCVCLFLWVNECYVNVVSKPFHPKSTFPYGSFRSVCVFPAIRGAKGEGSEPNKQAGCDMKSLAKKDKLRTIADEGPGMNKTMAKGRVGVLSVLLARRHSGKVKL